MNAAAMLRALRGCLNAVLLGAGLFVLVVGIAVWTGSLRLEPVLSGSMRPTLQPGDLAVTTRAPVSALRVGDIIAFYPPGNQHPEMHRIARISRLRSVTTAQTVTTVTTAGDANHRRVDPWGPIVLRGPSAYRLTATVPLVGFAPVWVSHIPGHLGRASLLIAAGLLCGLAALKIFRSSLPKRAPADHPGGPPPGPRRSHLAFRKDPESTGRLGQHRSTEGK